MCEGLDLPTFLDITPWNKKLQSKLLAGFAFRELRPPELFWKMRQVGERPSSSALDCGCTAETLHKAQEHLRRYFTFVGITERFEESLLLLKRRFNWNVLPYSSYRLSHNRPKRESLDASVIAAVERRNELDIALYHFEQRRFDDSFRSAGIDSDFELAARPENSVASALAACNTTLRMTATRLASIF